MFKDKKMFWINLAGAIVFFVGMYFVTETAFAIVGIIGWELFTLGKGTIKPEHRRG